MADRIHVAKLGSELVQKEFVAGYARDLSKTYDNTVQTIITSGALAAGVAYEESMGHDISSYKDVTLAQIGGDIVNSYWKDGYRELGISSGGLFVTDRELDDSQEGHRFRRTLEEARRHGVVTTVNENDPLSNKGLMANRYGGDNDGIASHIACCIGADALTLFTEKGGIFDDDRNLIEFVTTDNKEQIRAMLVQRRVRAKGRGGGRGGVVTKFDAAWKAAAGGVDEVRITDVGAKMFGVKTTRFVVG